MKPTTGIILGLVLILILCGANEYFINKYNTVDDYLVNNSNTKCPKPWDKYRTFLINNKCKIKKSYLLLDAPEECCMDKNNVKVESDCKEGDICGTCDLAEGTVYLQGTQRYPYQLFNTYCRPFIKYNWNYNQK